MVWFYYVARLIVRVLFLLLTRCRVRGKENVPAQGPLVVVANHLNLVDPPLLGLSLGRRVMFMAKEELFRPRLMGYFMVGLGTFPVSRGKSGGQAVRQALGMLANGWALALFPEGMRSRRGQLRSAFPGAALIASRYGAPVLPVGITGTEKIKGVAWLFSRPEIRVNIGPPFYLPPINGKLTKQRLAELTDIIMGRITELLPLEYHGYYLERKPNGARD